MYLVWNVMVLLNLIAGLVNQIDYIMKNRRLVFVPMEKLIKMENAKIILHFN